MKTSEKQNQLRIDANNAILKLRNLPVGCPIRVDKAIAKEWLLKNNPLDCGPGTQFYLQIRDIGLGVCEVIKSPIRFRNNVVVKTFVKD